MRTAPLLFLACAACSSASGPTPAGSFPVTLHSASGELELVLDSTAGSPTVGTDAIEITVTRAGDGGSLDGLDLTAVPWMPAMDHGTSSPTVTPQGGGKFVVSNLYFYMPGVWELKLGFTGPVTDHAEPEFQVQ